MNLRLAGLIATIAVVLILLGSMILGFSADGGPESWEMASSQGTLPATRVRVEVLNSSSIAGLARTLTDRLRAEGFDVVYYGNAGSLGRDSTTVLDRSGDVEAVQRVADALGVTRIETAIDTTLYVEATVVLAEDWPAIVGAQ